MPERLTDSRNQQNVTTISPDGTRVVFADGGQNDLMMLTLGKDGKVQPLMHTSATERNGEISPDGRWIAYEADDSGRVEIYVRPFPDVNSGRWQVSTEGGTRPAWARNGQELFYVPPTSGLMRVTVDSGTKWTASPPTKLLEVPYLLQLPGISQRTYDVLPDGSRFLLLKPLDGANQTAPANLVIVQNWFSELQQRVPVE